MIPGMTSTAQRRIAAWDRIPWATLIIVFMVIVGSVDVLLDGELSDGFEELVKWLGPATGALGIGRGIAARKG